MCFIYTNETHMCINFYMLRFYIQINAEQELFPETGRCRLNCSVHSLISPFPPPVTNSCSFHSRAAWITVIYVFLAMFQQLPHFSLIVHQRWKTPFEKIKSARKSASFNFLY